MAKKRQTFSKDFKAKVVPEALHEESTIQEIIVKHGVHPNQISQWKAQSTLRNRASFVDQIDSAYKVLSISHQCKLLGISRSQYYYEPSSQQDEKDFNLLVKIKEVQIEHPYYGYRRIWREINKNFGDTILSIMTSKSAWTEKTEL